MNSTDTNQASEVKRNSLNKSDRDVKLELEYILDTLAEKSADSDSRLGYVDAYVFAQEAKQEILDWHNKKTLELLDRLLEHGEDFTTFGDASRSVAVEYIEAERNKLKEEDK